MAPNATYPITNVLCIPVKPQQTWPMLRSTSTSTLASLEKKPIDDYLKKVFRHLREPFEKLEFGYGSSFIAPDGTVLEWKITIKKVIKKHDLKMLDALGMLNDAFYQFRLLLKTITHLGEAEIDELKTLKGHLFELTGYLDKILLFYSNAGLDESNKPTVEQIKHVAKKSRQYLMKLTKERLQSLIPSMSVKEEAILCSVLGLKDELAERLADLPSDIRSHQNDKYFLLRFLEEDAEYSGDLTETTTVATKLKEMGFTENRSVIVAEWIEKQPYPNHQPMYSWVQDYIDKLFTYDIFLNDRVPNYPYKENKVNKWFPFSVESCKPDDDEDTCAVTSDVQVLNTTPEKLEKLVQEKRQDFEQQYPPKSLYFHGTDHAGAQSILEDGINLGAGKCQSDFSRGCSFYLSTSSKFAIDWAKKHEASAIVMFSIEEDWLSKYQCLDLTSGESVSDLEKLKKHCRANERLPKTLRLKYKTCDYVKGPISQVESCHQICIRKQSMADELGDVLKIYGIVFITSNKVLWS